VLAVLVLLVALSLGWVSPSQAAWDGSTTLLSDVRGSAFVAVGSSYATYNATDGTTTLSLSMAGWVGSGYTVSVAYLCVGAASGNVGLLSNPGQAYGNYSTGVARTWPQQTTTWSQNTTCETSGGLAGLKVSYTNRNTAGTTTNTYTDALRIKFEDFGAARAAPVVPSASGCVLTVDEIVGVARAAGFTGSDVTTMAAVVLAESSGRVNVVQGPNTNDSYDLGLAQINTLAHPTYTETLLLSDPVYNLTAAHDIWTTAGDFSPWVAFTTSAHAKHVLKAQAAAARVTEPLPLHSCAESANPVTGTDEGESGCDGWNPLSYLECAFVPSDESVDTAKALGDDLSHVFPIGYVTDFLGTLNGVALDCGSDCSSPNLGFEVALPNGENLRVLGTDDGFVDWLRDKRGIFSFVCWLSIFTPIVTYIYKRLFPVVNE